MKGFQRRAIFPPKIASLCFQTSQHKGQKIHVSSLTCYGVTGSYKQADKNNNTTALLGHTTLHGLSRGLNSEPQKANITQSITTHLPSSPKRTTSLIINVQIVN